MAQPARRPPAVQDAPPIDPAAVERAYRRQRALRRARLERRRQHRVAGLRFWLVVLVLIAASIALGLTIWDQIRQLFGL